MRIYILYPNYFVNRAVTHTCLSIAKSLYNAGTYEVYLMGIASNLENKPTYYHDAIPTLLQSISLKLFSDHQLRSWTEFRFLLGLKKTDIVYLWPATSLELFKKIKAKGCRIITENINCHQLTSKLILDNEFLRLNLKSYHTINQNKVDIEINKLKLTNYTFSPSPEVSKSLLNATVPKNKIITSSYGITKEEILPITLPKTSKDKPVFLFVVRKLQIRKGIHLLLDYWSKANINATLKIVGAISPEAEHLIRPYYNDSSIQFIPFQKNQANLTNIFKESDIFIFPSLEEGSPLVTYAALGAGLPSLVSPMGGGGVIRHNIDGFVLPPHDKDLWIKAIRNIYNSEQLRNKMAISAWNHAHDYLWDKVGEKRSHILSKKFNL